MNENFVLFAALAKMMDNCGIEVSCNANTRALAHAFDLEKNRNEEREQFYKDLIIDIIKILDNKELEDFECIENIVCLLEENGLSGGSRHDFC